MRLHGTLIATLLLSAPAFGSDSRVSPPSFERFEVRIVSNEQSDASPSLIVEETGERIWLEERTVIDSGDVRGARARSEVVEMEICQSYDGPCRVESFPRSRVIVQLTNAGSKKLKEAAAQHGDDRFAIVVYGRVLETAWISDALDDGDLIIRSPTSSAKAEEVAAKIRASRSLHADDDPTPPQLTPAR